jgi:hypothetical protein
MTPSKVNQESKMSIISFNGKTYNNLEEMPADQRAAYEQVMAFMKDENHNGIPDMFEGDAIQKMIKIATNTRVVVNGQEVQSIESLPPEARAKFDKAMQKLSQLGILPSATQEAQGLVSQSPVQSTPQIAPNEPAFAQSPSFLQSSPSAMTEDAGPRTGFIIAIAVGAVLLLCALTAVGILLINR